MQCQITGVRIFDKQLYCDFNAIRQDKRIKQVVPQPTDCILRDTNGKVIALASYQTKVNTSYQKCGSIVFNVEGSYQTPLFLIYNAGFAPVELVFEDYPPLVVSKGVLACPRYIQLGCGDDEYFCPEKGCIFPAEVCPKTQPNLSRNNTFMADAFKENPGLWENLRRYKTPGGVTLAKCIKSGIDSPGSPDYKPCGLFAGDEESYLAFKPLFDYVIEKRHNYGANAIQPTNLNLKSLSKTRIDPTGNYVLTARVRTVRNVRGFKLAPSLGFDERRQLEKIIISGLDNLKGTLAGEYFPLKGSRSYPQKPFGMTVSKEKELRSLAGNLFKEPRNTSILSAGMGRHWPDSRGIFHNSRQNLFVWLNQEDHMRIISMEEGDNIQEVTKRFIMACDQIQQVLKSQGTDFMWNPHLGFISTSPSNIGTGLRAGVLIKLPLLSSQSYFKDLLVQCKLQARRTRSEGIVDISNDERIGKGEIDLVNIMIEGCSKFVRWEQALEKGIDIRSEFMENYRAAPQEEKKVFVF